MTRVPGVRQTILCLGVALLLPACSLLKRAPAPAPAAPVEASKPETPQMTPKMAADIELLIKVAQTRERLYQVAAPLLINNADLCKSYSRNLLGFTAQNKYSYPGDLVDAAQLGLGMGDRLQVTSVLAGSGAARAGLRRGDQLVAAEGRPLPTGPNAESVAGGVLGPLAASMPALRMSIVRNGDAQQIQLPVTRACAFRVELGNADNANTYIDGNRILITRGLMLMAETEAELAFLIAHDMAHNILGHPGLQRTTSTAAGMIDNLQSLRPDTSMLIGTGGLRPMPEKFDSAADALAIYLLARAGIKPDGMARFFKTLGENYPESVMNGYTHFHPWTASRARALDSALAELKTKQAAAKPLLP
ncbi:M48 family metallopeptidase [Massilia sp. TS11]|uniref:M48 family metallopeptidase n=1 Tax=Massilia sp. TS11 TaxID=2908003 RepID=UPI001EDB8138|nr:M48 family metallopeptidase [Massilia sp. TS11]MCG2582789.1 M48 family metallopeptidase [Massilia sp. TS11]